MRMRRTARLRQTPRRHKVLQIGANLEPTMPVNLSIKNAPDKAAAMVRADRDSGHAEHRDKGH
jgi:hypothetical protein